MLASGPSRRRPGAGPWGRRLNRLSPWSWPWRQWKRTTHRQALPESGLSTRPGPRSAAFHQAGGGRGSAGGQGKSQPRAAPDRRGVLQEGGFVGQEPQGRAAALGPALPPLAVEGTAVAVGQLGAQLRPAAHAHGLPLAHFMGLEVVQPAGGQGKAPGQGRRKWRGIGPPLPQAAAPQRLPQDAHTPPMQLLQHQGQQGQPAAEGVGPLARLHTTPKKQRPPAPRRQSRGGGPSSREARACRIEARGGSPGMGLSDPRPTLPI